jgi:Mitochondrial protein Pet127
VFLTRLDKNKRIYSVDGDSGFIEPSNVVLLKMGKYMEKMLTTPAQFFEDHYVLDPRTNKPRKELQQVQKSQRGAASKNGMINYEEDYFRYMKSGNLLLRSQIDA